MSQRLASADPSVTLEDDLQRRSDGHHARDVDEVADLLRVLGPLSVAELAERTDADELAHRSGVDLPAAIDRLVEERRAMRVTVAGDDRIADAADAARLRDALGVAIPLGLPTTFTDPVDHPLRDLVERYARTHAPFTAGEVADELEAALVGPAAQARSASEQVRYEFCPECGRKGRYRRPGADLLRCKYCGAASVSS